MRCAYRWTFVRIVMLAFLVVIPPLSLLLADGLRDNQAENVRSIPPLGVEVPEATRRELAADLGILGARIAEIGRLDDLRTGSFLPDVEIFHKAVHDALVYGEFFHEREFGYASRLLEEGNSRAGALLRGDAPWASRTGLVVRGYRSRIDHSVQPYGLVVPTSYSPDGPHRHRLDVWFHGRGERLSEVNFIHGRMTQPGTFTPPDTIVLHPYGRYSNAFKFAGETDVLEALAAVEERYRVDPDRVSVRGFSMGGAACWQFAVHYPDRWFAANPGAGFSETPEFLEFFQKETLRPTWYEETLWHLYDCDDWAVNLTHCPTVAYSGELDIQKQAADVMARALDKIDVELVHIIGPQTKHRYHPAAREEVERRLASLAERGRVRVPRKVRFATYTLKYPRLHWVHVERLATHWKRATVEAEITGSSAVTVQTRGVTQLSLKMLPGWAPLDWTVPVQVTTNGTRLEVPGPRSDGSWEVQLKESSSGWQLLDEDGANGSTAELAKRPGLQGPIDDAFMDSFIFVRPSGDAMHPAAGRWAQAELSRALFEWRRHFRGEARVKADTEITDEDIRTANLILWGDPKSNGVLGRLAKRLPIRWEEGGVIVDDRAYPAEHHALILVYPNPLNPARYVVLNSGFTYRDFAYLNNARQVPKLPDWAVVDLRTPPDTLWPGKIVAADFFDEAWQVSAR